MARIKINTASKIQLENVKEKKREVPNTSSFVTSHVLRKWSEEAAQGYSKGPGGVEGKGAHWVELERLGKGGGKATARLELRAAQPLGLVSSSPGTMRPGSSQWVSESGLSWGQDLPTGGSRLHWVWSRKVQSLMENFHLLQGTDSQQVRF